MPHPLQRRIASLQARVRGIVVPVLQKVAPPPGGLAMLYVEAVTGKLSLIRSDGTITRMGAGGGVPTSRTITAGTGLTGGGDLSADRSFAVSYGTTGTTACVGNDSRLSDARAPTGAAGGDLSGTYSSPTVAKVNGITPGATGLALLDDATTYAARVTLELDHAAKGIDWYGWAARGSSTRIFGAIGATVNLNANFGAGTATTVTRGRGVYHRPLSAGAPADGTLVGGWVGAAGDQTLLASSAMTWTAYLRFGTTTTVTIKGAAGVSNNNPTNADKMANDSLGIRYRPGAGDAGWTGFSTSTAGVTSTSALGVSVVASTLYVGRVTWDGTQATMAIATVDGTTGLWGSFSSPVTITTNLPSTTLGLCPVCSFYVNGTPGTAQSIDLGGPFVLPGVS